MSRNEQAQVIETTPADEETYNSSSLARFAWDPNPIGQNGTLHVEFQSGEQYIYLGVPEHLAEELRKRAYNPEQFAKTVGQFFYSNIRNRFRTKGSDYAHVTF